MHKYKLVGHKGLVIITAKSRMSSLVWLSLSGCLCLAVYVWLSCMTLWDWLFMSDYLFLAVYSISGCQYLASMSGRLCLYGCLMSVYFWLSKSGYLDLAVFIWFSISGCLCLDVNIFYFILFHLHDYVWQPDCLCLAVFVSFLYPPALAGLWFAVYAMGVNVRLSLSCCLCLAVHVWLSVTGCLQNGWLTLSVCLCLIVCLWLSCLVMCDRLSMSDLQCLTVSRFVYVWLSIPGCLSLAVLSGCI